MKQKLGQHFLVNKDKARLIVGALDLKPGDTVVEIGSGHGELTGELLALLASLASTKYVGIEKDEELVRWLAQKFQMPNAKFQIIEGDALKVLPEMANSLQLTANYKIVGNIPYYITGKLLRTIGELEHKPKLVALTVQKEVAERLTAVPPRMNLLAASVQFWANAEVVDYISRKDFKPQPEVDSAIIKLRVISCELKEMRNYYTLIKILFKQPRKTIVNNLISGLSFDPKFKTEGQIINSKDELGKKLRDLRIDPQDRPQILSVEKIKELAEALLG